MHYTFWRAKKEIPYRSELEMDNISYVLKKIQSVFIENHVSFVFEYISREVFRDLCIREDINFIPFNNGELI